MGTSRLPPDASCTGPVAECGSRTELSIAGGSAGDEIMMMRNSESLSGSTGGGSGYSMINSDSSSTVVLISPLSTSPSTTSLILQSSPSHISLTDHKPGKSPVLNNENLRMKSMFVRRYLKHNPFLNCLLPLSCICALVLLVYLLKDFPKHALHWIERQEANSWMLVFWFMVLFVIVSFPVTVGYLVLIITSGYLFGFLKGLLVVVMGANFGVAVAHYVIKSFQNKIPVHKLIKNETGRAILRVISGPRAFKVVLFCRLTPIPFGLQNTIFGVSTVSSRSYHTATLLGLLPAQTINVYLGSTLRSMRDVLNDHKTAFAGYSVFAVEVLVGVLLMVWVVQKARIELSNALLADIGAEEKLLTDRNYGPTASSHRMQIVPLVWLKKIIRLTKSSFRSWTKPNRNSAHNQLHYKNKPCRTV